MMEDADAFQHLAEDVLSIVLLQQTESHLDLSNLARSNSGRTDFTPNNISVIFLAQGTDRAMENNIPVGCDVVSKKENLVVRREHVFPMSRANCGLQRGLSIQWRYFGSSHIRQHLQGSQDRCRRTEASCRFGEEYRLREHLCGGQSQKIVEDFTCFNRS